MSDDTHSYDRVAIALHWAIGIAIIVLGLTELLRGEIFPKGSFARNALKALHEPVALAVFALILVRIAWRLMHKPPELPEGMRPWERAAAGFGHLALYALMIAVPVLGMATTYARGRSIDFGVFTIPALGPGLPRPTAKMIKELHEFVAKAILLLAGAHAASALWHHYVRHDDVLTRMLPRR